MSVDNFNENVPLEAVMTEPKKTGLKTGIQRTRSARGIEGWDINVCIRVPKKIQSRLKEKKQLRRHRFVSLLECPTYGAAKKLSREWEEDLEKQIDKARLPVITFHDCYESYGKNHTIRNKMRYMDAELCDHEINDAFEEKFSEWIDIQKTRNAIHRCKKADGTIIKKSLPAKLSKSTILGFIRDAKTILFAMCRNKDVNMRLEKSPIAHMVAGSNPARLMEITLEKEHRLMEVIGNDYPWFKPPVEFAKRNPIRPQDQFTITQFEHLRYDEINKLWRISYEPKKTKNKVLNPVKARPVVFDELAPYFYNLHDPTICPNIWARPGWKHRHEDPGLLYPINYVSIWQTIRKKAGCPEINFYDWRHHAVRYLLDLGYSYTEIMDIAGWTTTDMVLKYDPKNSNSDVRARDKMRRIAAASTFPSKMAS